MIPENKHQGGNLMKAKAAAIPTRKTTNAFKEAKAFSSFSVNDLKQAKDFYGETLGLEISETAEGLELNLADDFNVFIYPKPNHTAASFTVLNFKVDDITDTIEELNSLGINLEHYDLPDLKTDANGILANDKMKVAWFKDPAGNVLSIIEEG
jgi:catechol 2,3-dioxygenase-like lactoylglutathione lyase family enzyme